MEKLKNLSFVPGIGIRLAASRYLWNDPEFSCNQGSSADPIVIDGFPHETATIMSSIGIHWKPKWASGSIVIYLLTLLKGKTR